AALRLHIDTWRWAGVPFYIRAGKKMPITSTQVVVDLKRPPLQIFDHIPLSETNYFRFRLSPEVVISTGARVKKVGEKMEGHPVELIARSSRDEGKSPYEQLLGDAIRGDTSLFTRDDSVEEAWRIVEPLLPDSHGNHATPPSIYEPGTWGPPAADCLVGGGRRWHDPMPESSHPC